MRRPVDMVAKRQSQGGSATTMPLADLALGGKSEPIRVGIESILAPVSQRYILYYPILRHVTKSAKAALMLSQMLFWTRKYIDERPERDGWFWHTNKDWFKSTGLSRYELDSARSYLKESGCVEECLMGAPARMHFRIDLLALGNKIAKYANQAFSAWQWSDRTTLALLGRPISFLRGFVDLTGSVTAALYLSELCQKQRTAERDRLHGHITLNGCDRELDAGNGWLDLPLAKSAEYLGISEKRLRTARNTIKLLNVIQEKSSGGVQPRMLTRINISRLSKALITLRSRKTLGNKTDCSSGSPEKQAQLFDFAGMAGLYIPDLPKPANWNGGFVQSRPAETSKLDLPKPTNKIDGFGTSIKVVNTPIGVQPLPPIKEIERVVATAEQEGGGGALPGQREKPIDTQHLVLPENLRPDEQESARQLLAALPDVGLAQKVADEWSGQLRLGSIRVPLNYLSGLIKRASQGSFVLSAGINEAGRRAQRRAVEATLANSRSLHTEAGPVATEQQPTVRADIPSSFQDTLKSLGIKTKFGDKQ